MGECISLPAADIERPSPILLRDDIAYKRYSTGLLAPCISPISLEFLKPSVETNIVSTRDSTAAFAAIDSGINSISVQTTIHTESIYEDIQPAQDREE